MAPNDKRNTPETAIATRDKGEMTTPGAFMPGDFDAIISEGGFSAVETVMVGDPNDGGKIPYYLGDLIGPGATVRVQTPDGKENDLPTWAFHPRTKAGSIQNVTHIMPASHQIHAACARIYDQAERTDSTATVGIVFEGRGKTAKGRALNRYRVFEKYTKRNGG